MRILITRNFTTGLYNFNYELIQKLALMGYEIVLLSPYDDKVEEFKKLGCEYVRIDIDRHGTNPLCELKLLMKIYKTLKLGRSDLVLSYTIKPNLYAGLVCRIKKIPFIPNITGLGTLEEKSIMQKMLIYATRIALKKAHCIFMQNSGNIKFFADRGIAFDRLKLLPGSGVNMEKHKYEPYPEDDGIIRFLFIGRVMKAKGIEELIAAAQKIKNERVAFDAIGFCEKEYSERIVELERMGVIKFHGQQDDVRPFIKRCNAVVLPSYHEGMSNALLEAAASGRPVIATNVAGCIEAFDEGISGFGCNARDACDLAEKMIKFIELPWERKKEMGIAGRKKVEREFDREIVIEAYIKEIERIKECEESVPV